MLLEEFHDGEHELDGDMVIGGPVNREEEFHPAYWPESWTTGADGRFRIGGLVPEKVLARLHFRHPDFADDDLIVSTGLPVSESLRASNVKPVDASFTHTLEPARPVTGIVSDQATGKPLVGVIVEMVPARMRPGYEGNVHVLARTDESGRYRAAGAVGDRYSVTVYPDPASGYLSIMKRESPWPTGAKVLEVNVAVPRRPRACAGGWCRGTGTCRSPGRA